MTQRRAEHISLLAEGFLFLTLALGFAMHSPWVTWLWRFGDAGMTDSLLSALLASFGVGSIAIAFIGNARAAIGGALSCAVSFTLFPFFAACSALFGSSSGLRWHALVLAIVAAIALRTLKSFLTLKDEHASPRVRTGLRRTLGLLAVATAAAGLGLLAGEHNILPWALSRQTELLMAAMFLGLAADYAYVAVSAEATGCRVLLLGQIVYAAAMFRPLLQLADAVDSNARTDVTLAIAFVVLTACVSAITLIRGVERTSRTSDHRYGLIRHFN